MDKRVILLSIFAVLFAFAGGFLLANSLNRKELTELRAENENLKKVPVDQSQASEEGSLSDEEIRARIDEADRNPANVAFQKNLGLALYSYASMKRDAALLREVSRLITRVYENNRSDYEAVVALGNINFDLGYIERDGSDFKRAREFYNKALVKKPLDADVITDLGLTYLLSEPPENDAATNEFQRSLKINPKNEKTLQGLIQALQNENKRGEADKYATLLKEINPKNEILNTPGSTLENEKTNSQNQ